MLLYLVDIGEGYIFIAVTAQHDGDIVVKASHYSTIDKRNLN